MPTRYNLCCRRGRGPGPRRGCHGSPLRRDYVCRGGSMLLLLAACTGSPDDSSDPPLGPPELPDFAACLVPAGASTADASASVLDQSLAGTIPSSGSGESPTGCLPGVGRDRGGGRDAVACRAGHPRGGRCRGVLVGRLPGLPTGVALRNARRRDAHRADRGERRLRGGRALLCRGRHRDEPAVLGDDGRLRGGRDLVVPPVATTPRRARAAACRAGRGCRTGRGGARAPRARSGERARETGPSPCRPRTTCGTRRPRARNDG